MQSLLTACKHVLVVGYVRTHVCDGLCMSHSQYAVCCSPTRPHRYGVVVYGPMVYPDTLHRDQWLTAQAIFFPSFFSDQNSS